ncbi:hypothetical protein L7F22_013268 [Adiantum nelumboides]|nr:hypothetical protein [Adiantum nelumboides]
MAMLKAIGLSSVAAAAIATAALASPSSSLSRALPFRVRKDLESAHAFAARRPLTLIASSTAMALGTTLSPDQISEAGAQDYQAQTASLPDVVTEFMVDMKCEGCVSSVRKRLEPLEGVQKIDIDLPNQVVRVEGTASLRVLNEALEQTGRKARLIGQGGSDYVHNAAIVAEFKGPEIFGVVRIVQVSMELARVEASFSGLTAGCHAWSINEYGDLTRGAASTGNIYNNLSLTGTKHSERVGDLGVLKVDASGKAEFSGTISMLKVSDLPGRALVVYGSEDKSKPGIAAAVAARSAGVGENYKKLCTCDGTIIWDSTNNDFVKV